MPAARLAEVLFQAEEPVGVRLLRTEHELRNVSEGSKTGIIRLWDDRSALSICDDVSQVPFLPEKCKVLFAVGGEGCTGLTSEECVVAYKNQ